MNSPLRLMVKKPYEGEYNTPDVNPTLSKDQCRDVEELFSAFPGVFSDIPGCTSLIKHDIVLATTECLKSKVFPIPVHLQQYFQQEVDQLLEQGINKPSQSPHCSPVVMVKKSDGGYRMAVDYGSLNSITVFHAEPASTMEGDLYKFSGACYFTELDLTKAYYQVPLTERARSQTAFPMHRGLMEF